MLKGDSEIKLEAAILLDDEYNKIRIRANIAQIENFIFDLNMCLKFVGTKSS